MSGPVQVLERVFYLPSDTLEVVQDLVNKQFDVIVCDILNKDIILPTPLLPLSDVLDVNSKVYGAFSLIIPSVDDLDSFLRSYLHGKEGAPYETGACFIVKKHKEKKVLRELYHDLNWSINLNQIQCSGMFIWMNLGHVC